MNKNTRSNDAFAQAERNACDAQLLLAAAEAVCEHIPRSDRPISTLFITQKESQMTHTNNTPTKMPNIASKAQPCCRDSEQRTFALIGPLMFEQVEETFEELVLEEAFYQAFEETFEQKVVRNIVAHLLDEAHRRAGGTLTKAQCDRFGFQVVHVVDKTREAMEGAVTAILSEQCSVVKH